MVRKREGVYLEKQLFNMDKENEHPLMSVLSQTFLTTTVTKRRQLMRYIVIKPTPRLDVQGHVVVVNTNIRRVFIALLSAH